MKFASEKKLCALGHIPSGVINNRLIKVSMTSPFLKLILWRDFVLSWSNIFCLVNYKIHSIHLNLDKKFLTTGVCFHGLFTWNIYMEFTWNNYILKTLYMLRLNILVFGMGTDGAINTQYDLFFKWIYITNYQCMIISIHK